MNNKYINLHSICIYIYIYVYKVLVLALVLVLVPALTLRPRQGQTLDLKDVAHNTHFQRTICLKAPHKRKASSTSGWQIIAKFTKIHGFLRIS